jgi:WD40 repeat protein
MKFFLIIIFLHSAYVVGGNIEAHLERTITTSWGIYDAQLSPDGNKFVVASFREATIYSIADYKIDKVLWHGDAINKVRYNSDGTKILTCSDGKGAKIWNTENGNRLQELEHEGEVVAAEFSPDGTKVVTVSIVRHATDKWEKTHFIKIWDIDGREMHSIAGDFTFQPTAAIFDKDSTQVIVAAGSVITLFNLNGELTGKFFKENINTVWSISLSSNGEKLVISSAGSTVEICDLGTQSSLYTLKPTGIPCSATFSSDGLLIASADFSHASIWETQSGNLLLTISQSESSIKRINTAIFNENGHRLVLAGLGNLGGAIEIWSLKFGSRVKKAE